MTERVPLRRKLLLAGITLAIVVVLLEIGSFVVLAVVAGRLDHPVRRNAVVYARQTELIQELLFSDTLQGIVLDSMLGWAYRPAWARDSTAHNSAGLRTRREYAVTPPPGVLRIGAFGDSFVYGNEVPVDEAWPSVMEQSDSTIEVLNYGVGGYGVDQAFLRFQREGRALNPSVVIIAFTTDDLRRLVNVYRRFLSINEQPLFKPRYRLKGDTLELIPTPVRNVAQYRALLDDPGSVRQYGRHDQWFEPLMYRNPLYDWSATVRLGSAAWIRVANRYLRRDRIFDGGVFNGDSEAFRLQLAIFKAFRDSVASAGYTPVVLMLPDQESLRARGAGGPTIYQPLVAQLAAMKIDVLDAADAFAGKNGTDWFRPGGHYSKTGNQIVAEWLTPRVRALAGQPR